ncbi:hypothetical protein ACWGFX_01750 [Streptomyces xanthophaeus]
MSQFSACGAPVIPPPPTPPRRPIRQQRLDACRLGVSRLVVGKGIGIFLGAYLAARSPRRKSTRTWPGPTSWASPSRQAVGEHVKAPVLIASVTAAVLAATLLRRRNALYKRLYEQETVDADAEGIPDIHQRGEVEQTTTTTTRHI